MPKQEPDKDHPLELGELLRLKRAERPDEAFWSEFDRGLHQRMLQTLMKKDPWILQVVRALRLRLVQGSAVAAAAAVLVLFAVRPAFFNPVPGERGGGAESGARIAAEEAAHEAFWSRERLAAAPRDFAADQIVPVVEDGGYTRDFRSEAIELAVYEPSAYSPDSAFSGFGGADPAVAAIVY
jgi:hypothetical protein